MKRGFQLVRVLKIGFLVEKGGSLGRPGYGRFLAVYDVAGLVLKCVGSP